MTSGRAATTIATWGGAGLALLLAGALVLVVGWPRRIACGDETGCDGSSGHEAFVWVGAALLLAALYPLVVHAAARGTGLALAARQDAADPADVRD